MTDADYSKRDFALTVVDTHDSLLLSKFGDSDWCELNMETNGAPNGKITIRSRLLAQQLHFMLGSLLND